MSGETEDAVSGWTVDTLRESVRLQISALENRIADLRVMLDERYATQTKALDAAFKAAEQAVAVALSNAEKAVGKAEMAADKRFESVNEFREQLADQAASFLPRTEYDAAHTALIDKFETETSRNASAIRDLDSRLTSRLDLMTGGDTASDTARNEARLKTGQTIAVIIAMIGAISVAATIIIATRH